MQLGLKALLRDLGPEGLIEFLRQFGFASGDYSKERASLFPDGDLESLLAELIPVSAHQHLIPCERQWTLIHLKEVWSGHVAVSVTPSSRISRIPV